MITELGPETFSWKYQPRLAYSVFPQLKNSLKRPGRAHKSAVVYRLSRTIRQFDYRGRRQENPITTSAIQRAGQMALPAAAIASFAQIRWNTLGWEKPGMEG